MSIYGVSSGPYFPEFGLNTEISEKISVFSPSTGKYGPEETLYLNSFHAVVVIGPTSSIRLTRVEFLGTGNSKTDEGCLNVNHSKIYANH